MNPLPSHFRKLLISQNISLCEKSRAKQILLTEKTHKNTLKTLRKVTETLKLPNYHMIFLCILAFI